MRREDLEAGQDMYVIRPTQYRRGTSEEIPARVKKVNRVNVVLILPDGNEIPFGIRDCRQVTGSSPSNYTPYFVIAADYHAQNRLSAAREKLNGHGIETDRRERVLGLPAATVEQTERLGAAADDIFGEEET